MYNVLQLVLVGMYASNFSYQEQMGTEFVWLNIVKLFT